MTNAFEAFTRELAAERGELRVEDVVGRVDEEIAGDWITAELEDNEARWLVNDILDELLQALDGEAFLHSLTNPDLAAINGKLLRKAFLRHVAARAISGAEFHREWDPILAPLRAAIDHYDAIAADRRALARGEKL